MTKGVAAALVAVCLVLAVAWSAGLLNQRRSEPVQTPQEVFVQAVPVPDVSEVRGTTFNFTVVAKNPGGTALSFTPRLTISVQDNGTGQTVYSASVPQTSFTVEPHQVMAMYNGTVSLGKGALGRSYWLVASGPSTTQVKVVGERILVTLLSPGDAGSQNLATA